MKNYDGFLLDMGLMNLSAPTLPKFTLEIPDASKDYSRIFRLNPERDLFTRSFEHILTQQLPVFQFKPLRTDGLLGLY